MVRESGFFATELFTVSECPARELLGRANASRELGNNLTYDHSDA